MVVRMCGINTERFCPFIDYTRVNRILFFSIFLASRFHNIASKEAYRLSIVRFFCLSKRSLGTYSITFLKKKKEKMNTDSQDRTQSRRNVFRRSEKNSSYATDTCPFSVLVESACVNLQKSYRRECESEQTFALRDSYNGNIMRYIFVSRDSTDRSVKSCNNIDLFRRAEKR